MPRHPRTPRRRFVPRLTRLEDRTAPAVNVVGTPFTGLRFADSTGFVPPDTTMGVGPSQVVEAVNSAVRISSKTGTTLSTQTLNAFFGNPSGGALFDPVVVYDDVANRFIVIAVQQNGAGPLSNLYVAVSNTSTPTNLSTDFTEKHVINVITQVGGVNFWMDYPKLGYNADAIVITGNMYRFSGGGNEHTQIIALDKSTYLDANNATHAEFTSTRPITFFTMAAASMHGSVAGDPMWLVSESNDGGFGTRLAVTQMTNILSSSPTFTNTNVTVNSYNGNVPAAGQPGNQVITANDSRMLNAEWRNNRLVTSHTVRGSDAAPKTSWYEISTAGGTPSKTQEGVINPGTGVGTYFSSIGIAPNGNIGIDYMESSSSEFISVYATGQRFGTAAGTTDTPVRLKAGLATYTDFVGSPYRCGDYSAIGVDPTDGSFWVGNEYADAGGSSNWATILGNFLVFNAPPVALAGGPYTVAEGGSILLDGTASFDPDGTVASYQWDMNYNGVTFNQTATGAHPTFSAAAIDGPSIRTVALRVVDDLGTPSATLGIATVTITNVPPVITTIDGPVVVAENTPVTLTANVTDVPTDLVNPTYVWTVTRNAAPFTGFTGQGTASIGFNDTDAGPGSDTFIASLTVTDKDGGVSNPKTKSVTVTNGPPTATFTNDGPKPSPAIITFTFVSPTDPSPQDAANLRYSYDFNNDGNFASTGDILNGPSPSATFNYPTFGTYTVHGRISDDDGGFTDYTTDAVVNATPVANAGGPYTVNEAATILLNGTGSFDPDGSISLYEWDLNYNGVTFTPTASGATPTFDASLIDGPATRTVALRVTDNLGAVSPLSTATVTINNVAPVITTLGGPSAVVENTPWTLTANVTDAPADLVNPAYVWTVTRNGGVFNGFTGQGTASISFNDTDAPLAGDNFHASLTVTDKDGAASTAATKTVTVSNGAPTATFSNNGPVPQNSPVTFTFTDQADPSPQDAANLRYSYDLNNDGNFTSPGDILNSSSPTAVVALIGFGDFTVRGRIADDDGGFNDYTTTVHVDKLGNGGIITKRYYATGAGVGGAPHVRVFNQDGTEKFGFYAYAAGFAGGVRVATGDVTGDGVEDIITTPGAGGGPDVRVFDGVTSALVQEFMAYGAGFTGGVFVASADVNHDNYDDVIVGAGAGGAPHVKVFSGRDGTVLQSFFAYGATFTGGVTVAGGDVDKDGFADIITGAGPGGGPHVRVFSGRTGAGLAGFFAYAPSFIGGVFVAAGDITGDGHADIITGTGADPTADARLRVFNAVGLAMIRDLQVYPGLHGGVRVASTNLDGVGPDDIIVAPGASTSAPAPPVLVLDGVTLEAQRTFTAYDPAFLGGVYVG